MVGLLGTLALLGAACRPSSVAYDASRARAHVETLAGAIGPRPAGSPAARRARDYVEAQLRELGLEVRRQEIETVDPRLGLTAHVVNLIAWRDGDRPDAIALTTHYDSQPEAPGALDDALGVAVCLEAARALVAAPMRHALFVIVTDAEEVGLMGARAAIQDEAVRTRVKAFLNFDGTGAAGRGILFEAGPGRGTPLDAWARGAADPDGASFAVEIYRRLPNDTDFTVFRTTGAYGLNFAPIVDSYAYHTDRDVAGRVRDATLRQETVNAITTVRAMDATDLDTTADTPTFFTLARRGVVYGSGVARDVAVVAVVLGAIAWLLLGAAGWRARGPIGLVVTAVWALLAAAAVAGAMAGAAWALRAGRAELYPWYASPLVFLVLLVAAGWAGGRLVRRVGEAVPPRLRPWTGPEASWWAILPAWIALAGALAWYAPAASYLVTWPLVVASIVLAAAWRRGGGWRLASVAAALAAAAFWLGDTLRLFGFLTELLGWMPVVAPAWIHPALLAVAWVMVLAPVAAATARRAPGSRGFGNTVVAVCLVAAGVLAWRAPAYTADRPHRQAVRYVQDDRLGRAWWEVGGNEPAFDRGVDETLPSTPVPASLVADASPVEASVPLGVLAKPFRFRAPAPAPLAPPPADVRVIVVPGPGGRLDVSVTVTPRALVSLQILLPPGVAPSRSSLAGRVSRGRWTATYATVPEGGLTVGLTFDGLDAAALAEAAVVLTTATVPGASAPAEPPPWLSRERSAWTTRAVFVEPLAGR
ncbi:MAG: M20/M25/M40 family metallo-hydrolase [Vicinamibacterales bacterium]